MIYPTEEHPIPTYHKDNDLIQEIKQKQEEQERVNAMIRKREDEYMCYECDNYQMDPMIASLMEQIQKSTEAKRNKLRDLKLGKAKASKEDIEAIKNEISNTEKAIEEFGFERKCSVSDIKNKEEHIEQERKQLLHEYQDLIKKNESLQRKVELGKGN